MPYVELHCHSNYSFKEGASHVDELLDRAKDLGYPALALTDHDNLCGSMYFAEYARSVGIQPINGVEVTLTDGSHLTLLAENRPGYGNLCQLLSCSYIEGGRETPRLNPEHLKGHAEGVILLTGCPKGNSTAGWRVNRIARQRLPCASIWTGSAPPMSLSNCSGTWCGERQPATAN